MFKTVVFTKHAKNRMKERGIDKEKAGLSFIYAERTDIGIHARIYSKYQGQPGVDFFKNGDLFFVAKEKPDCWLIITIWKI